MTLHNTKDRFSMNHILTKVLVLVLALVCATSLEAKKNTEFTIPAPDNVSIRLEGGYVIVDMSMPLKMVRVSNNEAAIFTPVLKYGKHQLKLKSVGIYGRTRYYQYIRTTGLLTGDSEISFIRGTQPAIYQYTERISYRPWMENATLVLEEKLYECCEEIKEQTVVGLNARLVNPRQSDSDPKAEYPTPNYGLDAFSNYVEEISSDSDDEIVSNEQQSDISNQPESDVANQPESDVAIEPESDVANETESEVANETDSEVANETDSDVANEPESEVANEPEQGLDAPFFEINVTSDDAEEKASVGASLVSPEKSSEELLALAAPSMEVALETKEVAPTQEVALSEEVSVEPVAVEPTIVEPSAPQQTTAHAAERLSAGMTQERPRSTAPVLSQAAVSSVQGAIVPQYLYYKVQKPKKEDTLKSDTLLIEFYQRTTELNPNYGHNKQLLDGLTSYINTLKNNPDITLKGITLTNYSSPEGLVPDNTKMVEDRVQSIKAYLMKQCGLSSSVIRTETVPENWKGLREWIENNSIAHRQSLLRLIDGKREADNKEWYLKSTYTDIYPMLLNQVYPTLRYTIVEFDFDIKKSEKPAPEIRYVDENHRVIPLDDIFLMAQQYPEGSAKAQEIYLKAAFYYASSRKANYNAAVALLQGGNPEEAQKYIAAAGESPDVYYTRGLIYMALGDFQSARDYMKLAYKEGVLQAEVIYNYLNDKLPTTH